jgi:hypothetical protein
MLFSFHTSHPLQVFLSSFFLVHETFDVINISLKRIEPLQIIQLQASHYRIWFFTSLNGGRSK